MNASNMDLAAASLTMRVAQATLELYRLAYARVSPDLLIVQASENLSSMTTDTGMDVTGVPLVDAFAEFVGAEDAFQSILLGKQASFYIDSVNRVQPDGSLRYLTFRVLPFDVNQPQNGLLVIVEDVTQHGQLERYLLQNRNELQLAQHALAQTNAELDIRVRERTRELEIAKEQIEKQLDRINALHAVDLAILSATDLGLTLRTVLKEACAHLHVNVAMLMLFNAQSLTLELVASQGLQHTRDLRRRLGEGLLGKVALERRMIGHNDFMQETSYSLSEFASQEKFTAFYAVPLIARGDLVGVLGVGNHAPLNPEQEWFDFLDVLSAQSALAIDNSRSFERLQRSNLELALAYDITIEGWARALDLRDHETHGHSQRVTDMTLQLAHAAGLSEAELVHIKRGAYLHDIGKMGIPDAILLKTEKLTDSEWDIMRKHPTYAYDMLSPIEYLRPALDIPYCHHEKWDGTGYPRGLHGEQIPLAARLFAVVDVWDALSSDRPYREGWEQDKVRDYLRSQAGLHFDPKVVGLFMQVLDEEHL